MYVDVASCAVHKGSYVLALVEHHCQGLEGDVQNTMRTRDAEGLVDH